MIDEISSAATTQNMIDEISSAATTTTVSHHQDVSLYDEEGSPKRTGTMWMTSSYIITAVIGSGTLSLAWSIAQLGWSGGLVVMIFGFLTLYTSHFLANCYRAGDPITGKRSYTYMEAVDNILENRGFKGTIAGAEAETHAKKVWAIFQALGNIAFAYSFSDILIEIQDTIKSPLKVRTMKRAINLSIATTTTFYVLCGCIGYGAFGNSAPGNLLTAFDKPFWLVDIANLTLLIQLAGAYQVYSQPLFAFIEERATKKWEILGKEHKVQIPFLSSYNLNIFRLVWRSLYVVVSTVIAMLIPFFNDILGVIGALGFWPLSVYFSVEMHIKQKKIPKWSGSWILLQSLSMFCLMVTLAALVGSIVGVLLDLKTYKPFSANL
ncbi:hypothetical protein HN51_045911 [Arachis hypogaea]